jgi:hypothetical protein
MFGQVETSQAKGMDSSYFLLDDNHVDNKDKDNDDTAAAATGMMIHGNDDDDSCNDKYMEDDDDKGPMISDTNNYTCSDSHRWRSRLKRKVIIIVSTMHK